MAKAKIFLVEDDPVLAGTLTFNLEAEGCDVDCAQSAREARKLIHTAQYDLAIMDVNLPDGNGFDLCRELKQAQPGAEVLFLTANDMESDMIRGYELGAADYVTKPFPISVFLKKVAALLKVMDRNIPTDKYDDGYLVIDFLTLVTTLDGVTLAISPLEYKMLRILTANPEAILTRQTLLEKLWDADGNFVDEHTLTTTISRIRGKVEKDGRQYIKTAYGMGYMWIGGGKQ